MYSGGRETSGPLVDFLLLMYHVGATLHSRGSGPFFYLSKLEGSKEAALWNRIFIWTQEELGLPRGTIRACVLIENVFAAFEMEVGPAATCDCKSISGNPLGAEGSFSGAQLWHVS